MSGVVLGLLLTAAAGCGSAGPTGSTSGASAGNPGAAAFQYARCMRSHGATGFPDPQVHTSPGQVSIRQVAPASVVSAPRFKTAQRACRGIIPSPRAASGPQGPGSAVLLAFARCLRGHGLSGFPDPNPQGHITPQMLSASGVNLRTPVFLSAAKACIGVTHGAITPDQIRAAISGPH